MLGKWGEYMEDRKREEGKEGKMGREKKWGVTILGRWGRQN